MIIANPTDPCRRCKGNGYTLDYEPDPYTGEMKTRSNYCASCEGTGSQTILVFAPITKYKLENTR